MNPASITPCGELEVELEVERMDVVAGDLHHDHHLPHHRC